MKKKAFIMTMTLALVTGLFAGCGGEQQANEQENKA